MSELSWFALRTIPQREQMVRKLLRWRGAEAYVKTESKLGQFIKGRREEKEYTAAPGYVFAGLSGVNPWSLTRNCHLIRSVVSYQDRPARLDPQALADFLAFKDEASTPDYFRFFRKSDAANLPSFDVGEMVTIDSKSGFAGFTLPVKNVDRSEVIFELVMMGRAVDMRVPMEQCYKAKVEEAA